MADRAIKMRRRKKAAAQQQTTTAPGLVRLEMMGRQIIMQVLAVQPSGQANEPLPPEPRKCAPADEPTSS